MINLNAKIIGKYRLVINKADGTEEDTGWFNNLILNQGLDRLGSSPTNQIVSSVQIGTGTSTPANTQTGLDAYTAGVSGTNSASTYINSGSPNYATTLTYVYTFAQGAVVGNMSEVGVGWATSGNYLFSRALILDTLGNPTTLTLIALDQLTVYYSVEIIPPLIDSTGTVTLSSIVYNYTIRTAYAGSFGQLPELLTSSQYFSSPYAIIPYAAGATLGAITTGPIGTSGTTGTAVASTYTSGNYYLDGTYTLSITQGNVSGGIQCLLLTYGYTYSPIQFQVYFTSPIPKDNTKALTLTLRFSWSRG